MDRQRRDLKIAMQRAKENCSKKRTGQRQKPFKRLESEKTARASEQRIAYLQSVSLAYIEWQSGNMEAAEALLMRCPPPLRDWEWRYVQRLCHQELNVLAIGSDSVHDIACPPSVNFLFVKMAV